MILGAISCNVSFSCKRCEQSNIYEEARSNRVTCELQRVGMDASAWCGRVTKEDAKMVETGSQISTAKGKFHRRVNVGKKM